jgi:RIO kinase 1
MSIMQCSSSRYEPTADKLYDQPLLEFVRTKNIHTEKEQEQSAQNIVEVEEDESESCSSSDEDDSWHDVDPKMVNPLLSPSTSFWSILLPTLRINPSPT